MDNSLTDIELKAFFDRLFPHGFAGADVLLDIAPEGWMASPLLACFHPSLEQVFEECLRMHRNSQERIRKKNHDQIDSTDQEPTLEKIRMEKLLKVEQLSEIIQVSPSTIYHWTQAGFIPHYKLPKGLRFRIAEIENWLKRQKRKGRDTYALEMELPISS